MLERLENITAGEICVDDLRHIKEAVCIQTEKVFDSCREKDCIEDLEVFGLPMGLINRAIDVTCADVDVENVIIDVEPLRFKRGFFTVTVTFVFKVTVEIFFRNQSPQRRTGVAIFSKKVVLFGSQGRVKIFKSKFKRNAEDIQFTPFLEQDNRPNGKVEVAEPICLSARIEEGFTGTSGTGVQEAAIINSVLASINQEIEQENTAIVNVNGGPGDDIININIDQNNIIGAARRRRVLVTIGLFSIIKLVRVVQLLVPAFGFCNPPLCNEISAENPCELFDTIEFPREAFFPPQKHEWNATLGETFDNHSCCD